MKKVFYEIKDWYLFGKEVGFWFATKYKLGLAKEGKDFFTNSDSESIGH